jgi:hypothetical protein
MYKYIIGAIFTLGVLMAQPNYEWEDTPLQDKILFIGLWPITIGYIIGDRWLSIEQDITSLKPKLEKN